MENNIEAEEVEINTKNINTENTLQENTFLKNGEYYWFYIGSLISYGIYKGEEDKFLSTKNYILYEISDYETKEENGKVFSIPEKNILEDLEEINLDQAGIIVTKNVSKKEERN